MAAENPPPRSPRPPDGRFFNQLASALDLPFVLVGSIVIGGGLGYLIDREFGTSPIFGLVLGALGFAGGIYEILRRLAGRRNG